MGVHLRSSVLLLARGTLLSVIESKLFCVRGQARRQWRV